MWSGKMMDKIEATKVVCDAIKSIVGDQMPISDETPLIGEASSLDSMKLVELCLALEDMAEEHGFEFDWTSDSAMSRTQSMFRTVKNLAVEFSEQSEKK